MNFTYEWNYYKVEKILKSSLDSIPTPLPSVKIQIMGGKVCLGCKGKTLLGVVNKHFVFKSLLTSPSNVLPYYPNNLNFNLRWRWWDRIQAIFLNFFYFERITVPACNWHHHPGWWHLAQDKVKSPQIHRSRPLGFPLVFRRNYGEYWILPKRIL